MPKVSVILPCYNGVHRIPKADKKVLAELPARRKARWPNFPRVSVIVCTRDRTRDLARLLLTLLNQSYTPIEIIIVDGSTGGSTQQVVNLFDPKFVSVTCRLRYVKESAGSLPAARNLGVTHSVGDFILFVDDDTLLDRNVVSALVTFLKNNPDAQIVSPQKLQSTNNVHKNKLARKVANALSKALMLTYQKENKMEVRRSGTCVFPSHLTKIISAQRLRGCCFCSRREVFNDFHFDANLKRWGYLEDLDFFYRVHRKNPEALYAISHAKISHKASVEARLSTKQRIYMMTTYWFYVFFKDVFEGSILNLIAFLWALTGNLVTIIGGLVVQRKPKHQWWELVYLVNSYFYAFRHLREIKRRDLDFFNKQLKE